VNGGGRWKSRSTGEEKGAKTGGVMDDWVVEVLHNNA